MKTQKTPHPAAKVVPESFGTARATSETFDPIDYAQLQMHLARAEAARAKLNLFPVIQRELQEAEQSASQIFAKYQIRQGDQVQPDGRIVRAEAADQSGSGSPS